MSYINEINGFHKWVQTHPELPTSARILWFTLMHYNNSCGWKRVFNVPISLLMGDSGLSRSSIVRARKLLQELGRIRYTTRSDMKATEYELLPMSDEPGIATGYATGYDTYDTRRDTGHDTVCDTQHDTPHDTGRDIEYDTACDTPYDTVYDTSHDTVSDTPYDIAHDTQDGHIPRLDQTGQDQTNTITNTIQDINTRQDNQTRPDNISEFSFSGGEKKEKIKEKIKEEEFVPPTVEMVEEYCKERGNVIDPEMFVAYYDSVGWVRGKYPMKDWKAAVRSWEKYDAEYRENGYY